jgi:hypothetical protein
VLYIYAGDDPVNEGDPSGLCWSLAPGVPGPCLESPDGVPYDGSFTIQEIAQYPKVLEPSSTFPNALNPTTLEDNLGGFPPGVKISEANSESAGKGPGFRMIEDGADGNITIRWSPGSARLDHMDDPYWRVSSKWVGKSRVGDEIPADEWDDEAAFWAARAGDTNTEPTSGEGPGPSGGGGDSSGSGGGGSGSDPSEGSGAGDPGDGMPGMGGPHYQEAPLNEDSAAYLELGTITCTAR